VQGIAQRCNNGNGKYGENDVYNLNRQCELNTTMVLTNEQHYFKKIPINSHRPENNHQNLHHHLGSNQSSYLYNHGSTKQPLGGSLSIGSLPFARHNTQRLAHQYHHHNNNLNNGRNVENNPENNPNNPNNSHQNKIDNEHALYWIPVSHIIPHTHKNRETLRQFFFHHQMSKDMNRNNSKPISDNDIFFKFF